MGKPLETKEVTELLEDLDDLEIFSKLIEEELALLDQKFEEEG